MIVVLVMATFTKLPMEIVTSVLVKRLFMCQNRIRLKGLFMCQNRIRLKDHLHFKWSGVEGSGVEWS